MTTGLILESVSELIFIRLNLIGHTLAKAVQMIYKA